MQQALHFGIGAGAGFQFKRGGGLRVRFGIFTDGPAQACELLFVVMQELVHAQLPLRRLTTTLTPESRSKRRRRKIHR